MHHPDDAKADNLKVRQLNMAAVMKCLRLNDTLSRADISKKLGLTRSTVTNIINELLSRRLVIETTLNRTGAGRPGRLLEINENGGFAVGVEINIGRIAVITTNMKASVIWEKSVLFEVGNTEDQVIRLAEDIVDEAVNQGFAAGLRPLGIGVGIVGMVDVDNGVLLHSPALGWADVPIRSWLARRFKLPVYVENEANAAAIGYSCYGEVSGFRHMIYLSIGAGMAAGMILDGRIYRGSAGMAGQIGHIKKAGSQSICTCGGKGCLVSEIGERSISRQLREVIKGPHREGVVPREDLIAEKGDRVHIAATIRAMERDDEVRRVVEGAARTLGLEIANLINIFNPERVVLGGAMFPLYAVALYTIRQCVREMVLPQMREHVTVDGVGRVDSGVFGAASLVLEAVEDNPLMIL